MSNDDSLDWKNYGRENIINTVVNHKHLGNGSIILCHNGAKYTAQALDDMIKGLKEKGYEIVPISKLIYKKNYQMDHEGRQFVVGCRIAFYMLLKSLEIFKINKRQALLS